MAPVARVPCPWFVIVCMAWRVRARVGWSGGVLRAVQSSRAGGDMYVVLGAYSCMT